MRLETYELPALGEYVHDPRAAYVLVQGNIALDHQRFVEASGGVQGELNI